MAKTDTDSVVFHTKTGDTYQDLKEMNDQMDLADMIRNIHAMMQVIKSIGYRIN